MGRKLKYEKILFPKDRPKCPRCGGLHVISRGVEWGCGNCGRRWAKRLNWGKNYEKKEMDGKAVKGED